MLIGCSHSVYLNFPGIDSSIIFTRLYLYLLKCKVILLEVYLVHVKGYGSSKGNYIHKAILPEAVGRDEKLVLKQPYERLSFLFIYSLE